MTQLVLKAPVIFGDEYPDDREPLVARLRRLRAYADDGDVDFGLPPLPDDLSHLAFAKWLSATSFRPRVQLIWDLWSLHFRNVTDRLIVPA